jgi:2-amino-4-hydroxy-6-hydroxymethyldihydropteridine diphosphokinase
MPDAASASWHYAIGVGANLGDRAATIKAARARLDASGLARVAAASPLHATAPCGGPQGQPAFLNGAWLVASGLGPHQLLALLQGIETALGRTRSVRWGPRTIDLDILLRDDGLVVDSPVLTVPHPLLAERPFVLTPLVAIAGSWRHPVLGRTISELAVAGIHGRAGGDSSRL